MSAFNKPFSCWVPPRERVLQVVTLWMWVFVRVGAWVGVNMCVCFLSEREIKRQCQKRKRKRWYALTSRQRDSERDWYRERERENKRERERDIDTLTRLKCTYVYGASFYHYFSPSKKAAHTSHFFSCTFIRAVFQCCQRLNDDAYANEKMLIVTKKGEETPLKIFLSGNEASGYFLIQKDI